METYRDPFGNLYYAASDTMPYQGGTYTVKFVGGGGSVEASPILQEVEELEETIEVVDDYDSMEESEQSYEDELERELEAEQQELVKEMAAQKPQENKVDTTFDNELAEPEQRAAFFVGEHSFNSKNDALKYEVLKSIIDHDYTVERGEISYDEDEADNELERICQNHFVPLNVLAEKIDKIAVLLRSYEQKKDR